MLKMNNKNLHLTAIYWQKWLSDKNLKIYQNVATSFFWHFMPSYSQKEKSRSKRSFIFYVTL